jgi:hypothetical protein
MVHSRVLSRPTLLLSAALALCCTSCKEHEKIAKQADEVMQKVEELRAQKEASDVPTGSLRGHPIARKGKKAMDSAIEDVRREVTSLEERKSALEFEVATLQKDFADYRAKNP